MHMVIDKNINHDTVLLFNFILKMNIFQLGKDIKRPLQAKSMVIRYPPSAFSPT